MIRFNCDYLEGCHPRILKKLTETNFIQTGVYGEDFFSVEARNLIRKNVGVSDADVYFLVGGTQTNLTVIGAILKSYEGVLSAVTGHVNVHETGAIEAIGHKVITIPTENGKLTADQVLNTCIAHKEDPNRVHTVCPGMVYISQPTEYGTLYSLSELEQLSVVCHKVGIPLYVDGARLGYGIASPASDFTMADIARLSDVFYIGGTKQGTLFGEAVVILNDEIKKNFKFSMKQRGALLAKGRLLGIQFMTLFEDEDPLYLQMSREAVDKSTRIRKAFEMKGIRLLFDSWTNMLYPVLPNKVLSVLKENFIFDYFCKISENETAVRICTSWATTEENTLSLVDAIYKLKL